MGRLEITVVLFLTVAYCRADQNETKSARSIIESVTDRETYDKTAPPRLDKPTKVAIGIYVNSFYAISEETMDYQMSFYLRLSWTDQRLAFESFTVPSGAEMSKILMHTDYHSKVWQPDIFFGNEKIANFHHVTVKNRMMTINKYGSVWDVTKISATFSCPMKLQKYPFDTQHCSMMFESFSYTGETLYLAWLPSPVNIDPNMQLSQFTLTDKILYDCTGNYTAGSFPCLEIQFVFRRDTGYFLVQIYIPSMLIVALSWVSFWISPNSASARILLPFLCILTLTTQGAWAGSKMARVSYVKAIDVWFSICLAFVFVALVEFAAINLLKRKRDKNSGYKLQSEDNIELTEDDKGSDMVRRPIMDDEVKVPCCSWSVDKTCGLAFPLAFIFTNLVYWTIYTLPGPKPVSSG